MFVDQIVELNTMPPAAQLSLLARSLRFAGASPPQNLAQTVIASRSLNSSWHQRQRNTSTSFERYGAAKDLPPLLDKPGSLPTNVNQTKTESKSEQVSNTETDKQPKKDSPKVQDAVILDTAKAHPSEIVEAAQSGPRAELVETGLQMLSATPNNKPAPPHLETPRYVHHFDTYTLVNDLQKGGFSKDQSVTTMKAVRILLAENLDIARQGLVSKSDVENESYLFRAACSELKTEIQSARRMNAEKMRSERALLQYEVDILSQGVTQESLNLKDELKGLFDDRKMAARMEQRTTENRIQEMHYKITSVMAGEAKGEVEGLRWYLTRMLVFTLAGTIRKSAIPNILSQKKLKVVVTGITYLSISTHRAHKEQERQKKAAQETASSRPDAGTSYTVPSRDTGTQTAQTDTMLAEIAADKSSSAGSGYVSLG